MNPATVKKILGEKSVLAMYRDCLKVVPLMNQNVRFGTFITQMKSDQSSRKHQTSLQTHLRATEEQE